MQKSPAVQAMPGNKPFQSNAEKKQKKMYIEKTMPLLAPESQSGLLREPPAFCGI